MAKLEFSFDDTNFKNTLAKLAKKYSDFKKPLSKAGLYLMRETDKRFQNEIDPDSVKWKALRPSTLANRRKRGKSAKILQDSGLLKMSITKKNYQGNIWRLNDVLIEIGTNLSYAGIHQFGGNSIFKKRKKQKKTFGLIEGKSYRIPKRSFLGINQHDSEMIVKIFIDWSNKN